MKLEYDGEKKGYIKRYGNYIPIGGKQGSPLLLIGPDCNNLLDILNIIRQAVKMECVEQELFSIMIEQHLLIILGKFFAGMFTFLTVVGLLSCVICLSYQKSIWAFVGAITVSVIELTIYAITALKDPGIVQDPELDIEQLQHNEQVVCLTCKVEKKKGRYHCMYCDVCIDGHDHHCPWTSKCIGKGNIIPFYGFLLSTSIFFIYHFLVSLNNVFKQNI